MLIHASPHTTDGDNKNSPSFRFSDTARQERRSVERSYYLSAENAAAFDKRSAAASNLRRYADIAEQIGKTAVAGSLLDIGCGTARMLIEIASRHPALKTVGIDVSREMIRLGRRNVSRAGMSNRIELKNCSAEELETFAAGTFDLVISCGCLSAWLEPSQTLSEIHRIVKEGGTLFLHDWNRRTHLLRKAALLMWPGADLKLRKRIKTAFRAAYSPEEIGKLASDSTFSIEQLTTEGHWIVAIMKK
jgi:ubiquinone/menaquinone biosynthesis C-methylase UbiE